MSAPSIWTLLDWRRPGQNDGWSFAVYLEGRYLGDVRKTGVRWEARTPDGIVHTGSSTKRMAGYELHRRAERGEA